MVGRIGQCRAIRSHCRCPSAQPLDQSSSLIPRRSVVIPRLPVNRNSVRFQIDHNGHSFRIRFRFRSRRRSTERNQDFRSEVSTAYDQPTGHPTVHAALSAPTGGAAYHRNLADGGLPLPLPPHAQPILAPLSSRGKVPFARWHAQAQPGTLGLMLANDPGTQRGTSVILHRAHKGPTRALGCRPLFVYCRSI